MNIKTDKLKSLFAHIPGSYVVFWTIYINHRFLQVCFSSVRMVYPNVTRHMFAKCNICGWRTILFFANLKLPRESLVCPFCHSISRNRHLAKQIMDEAICGLRTINQIKKRADLSIFDTDHEGPFYKILRKHQGYVCSFYSLDENTNAPSGLASQDLTDLTFCSESFDLVITEDVLEHVRDYKRALKEIYRVLKPGGSFAFTVPFLFNQKTIVRVDTSGEKDVHLLPPEYHIGWDGRGILAYRTFGTDLMEDLVVLGFKVNVSRDDFPELGIFDSYVFTAKKV